MEFLTLLVQTLILRSYVFVFLVASLITSSRLLGWKRTGVLFGITWLTAFLSEFASTRIGIPFGDYYYTGSTIHEELYISNIPFMDSLSFTFLLYASYCLALVLVLPLQRSVTSWAWRCDRLARTSWPVITLTTLFFTFIDIIIDPVTLRGDRWFLGQIYGYAHPGVYFGVPIANFLGWATVGVFSIGVYCVIDRNNWLDPDFPREVVRRELLWGTGIYYSVLAFNLIVTFWIGEYLIGMVGCLIYLPISLIVVLRMFGQLHVEHINSPVHSKE